MDAKRSPEQTPPRPPVALAQAVVTAVEALLASGDATWAPGWPWAERAAIIASLDRTSELVGVYRARLLAAHKDDGQWVSSGDRTFENHRARVARTPVGMARAETELGQGLADMPAAAKAVQRGQVGLAHVRVLTRLRAESSETVRRALDAGGTEELLALAEDLDVATFTRRAKAWAAGQDTDAAEASFQQVCARRYARLTDRDGGTQIDAFVDPVIGASLRTALEALTPVPSADDTRTPGQRAADALATMAARILDSGADKIGAQIRPHISLVVSADTWTAVRSRRAAEPDATSRKREGRPVMTMPELDDGTAVPLTELERLICDCELTRVVFDAESVPIDVGRTQRTYSKSLRRAVLVRDGHCRWPGCTMRSAWCEVHHVKPWANGGATSVGNAISLCGFHHRCAHTWGITIRPVPGGHAFIRRDGSSLGTTTRDAGIDRMLPVGLPNVGSTGGAPAGAPPRDPVASDAASPPAGAVSPVPSGGSLGPPL